MKKLSKKQIEELKVLESQSEYEIDTSDIPEKTNWDKAQIGKFYRPIKKQITLRLDADMIEWFKSQEGKYQTRINLALREYMEHHD